jgi:general secretion pathway protein C
MDNPAWTTPRRERDYPMSIANSLMQLKGQPPDQWLKRLNRFLPGVVTAVLVIAAAERLAALTWAVIPSTPSSAPPPMAIGGEPGGDTAPIAGSYDALLDSHLFGAAPAQSTEPAPVTQVVDAPDTSLNLQLTGVNAHPDSPDAGQAFIASGRGEQKMYMVGNPIDGGNGATLHSVFADRVLLNRAGRLETLRLPKEDGSRPATTAQRAPRLAPAQPADSGISLRDAISDNATFISEAIRPTLERDGDQTIGFRLQPGRNRDAFTALGLQDGDILTDVNGMPMNDTQSAMRVYQALEEAQMANVTILRNGTPQVLVIDMSLIQRLGEGRQ